MLHITNGDSAAGLIREAGLPGSILPWRDMLHDGPVPAGLSLEELSEVRARFLAELWAADLAEVRDEFARRDETLAGFAEHDEVTLWFEHDLYDQLQLLQILDWFATHDLRGTTLRMICIGEFPGVERFIGLGQLDATQMAWLHNTRHTVRRAELELARDAWAAFRSPDPGALVALLERDTSALPFLRGALIRHLEEYPSVREGLSRTERQILEVLASGDRDPIELFRAAQDREERPFLGDATFWLRVRDLSQGEEALVRTAAGGEFVLPRTEPAEPAFREQTLVLTVQGRQVLDGKADRVRPLGIDRWYGGVHLEGPRPSWRWDEAGWRLVRTDSLGAGME